jgi:hypothetical protein
MKPIHVHASNCLRLAATVIGLCAAQAATIAGEGVLSALKQIKEPVLEPTTEQQLTRDPGGHILTNSGVWSPDSQWIVYDIRSDPAGTAFDGTRIEAVHVATGEVKRLYQSGRGACCGVATWHPSQWRVVFILGPENPTPDWQYGPSHRQGVIVDWSRPGVAQNLDARDLTPPFTPGALRGGSHVHQWDAAGQWVSFTYQDALVETDIRDVGVCVPRGPVPVSDGHPRNHPAGYFSVLATRTVPAPQPGSDEIGRACEEGWVGADGYLRPDGTRQKRALAFQGHVVTRGGRTIVEAFLVDLPEDVTVAGDGPLAGTSTRRPAPPKGAVQRRLTYTADRRYPGLQGPRHWLRSTPDGSRIALLMKDDQGVVQIWTVSPHGGPPVQLTRNAWDVASAFTWSPDGKYLAYVMDHSVFRTEAATGRTQRLTPRSADADAPRPEACVFSPDGQKIAYVRHVADRSGTRYNQLFAVSLGEPK